MTNMYFWHPAYNDYPVVGVNKFQAEAFLHWKTERAQKELNKEHPDLKIEYDLPWEYQWEMVASSQKGKEGPTVLNTGFNVTEDRSYLTDLRLNWFDTLTTQIPEKDDSNHIHLLSMNLHPSRLTIDLQQAVLAPGTLIVDGFFHTAPVDFDQALSWFSDSKKKALHFGNSSDALREMGLEQFKINRDANDICYMGGNLSEWMKDSYKDNWLPIYTRRHQLMKKLPEKDIQLLANLEDYYNSKCDTNGYLVRGANWSDERFSNFYGKNKAGMNAKTFVSPSRAHCTLGFRYVVRVIRKGEGLGGE